MVRFGVKLLAIAAVLFLHPTPVKRIDPLTGQQRFAMAVQGCVEASAADKPEKCALFGKIQVVDSFPDVKIQVVSSFSDIKVKWVDSFADDPGEWQRVDSFPDFKIQFVDSFPDYTIEVVDSFPGCD